MSDWVNEPVAICIVCEQPVRRNQPRKIAGYDEATPGLQWWKHDRLGGSLVHLECAKTIGGTA